MIIWVIDYYQPFVVALAFLVVLAFLVALGFLVADFFMGFVLLAGLDFLAGLVFLAGFFAGFLAGFLATFFFPAAAAVFKVSTMVLVTVAFLSFLKPVSASAIAWSIVDVRGFFPSSFLASFKVALIVLVFLTIFGGLKLFSITTTKNRPHFGEQPRQYSSEFNGVSMCHIPFASPRRAEHEFVLKTAIGHLLHW